MDDEKDEQQYNQSHHMEQSTICNKGLNHQEEDQGSRLSFLSCFSISESLCQEGFISLDSFEEQNNNSFETHEENQVLNSEISNEVVDVPFESCHEHTLHGSSENKFNNLQVKLQFEQPHHSKQIA